MNKSILWALIAVGAMSSVACNNQSANQVQLTIFHTNDMHSHVRAAKADPFGLGGLARLSTLLKSLRKTAPVSLTLDAGDFSEGTWYFAVDTGASMLKMMSAMGYDAACLGNHDFLIGPDEIIHTINTANASFPVMAANLDTSAYPRSAEFKQAIPSTTIKTVNGIRVGIIGLTTYELLYNSYMSPVAITSHVDAATKYAKELRPQVDVLLIVSHNNFDMNKQIAKSVPGVDAVISGHSHRKIPQVVLVSNAGRQVPVVETGQWAQFLGDLKLDVIPANGNTLASVRYSSYGLHPVSPDLAEDPEINAMISEQDRILNTRFGDDVVNHVIGDSEFDMLQQDSSESALGNLAVKSYRAETSADLSMEILSLTGVSVAKGPTTVMDAHDVVPHIYSRATGREWALRVWNARGSDLALIFNVFYTVDGLMPLSSPLGWLSADNAVVTWNSSGSRVSALDATASARALAIPRVRSITIGGVPLDPRSRYRVAISDGFLLAVTLANEMLHLGVDLADVRDSGVDAWQSVVNYVTQVGHLTIQDFGVGGHSFTESPDLGIYYYTMAWDGANISYEVRNQGLQASAPGTVNCSFGLRDDTVAYGTAAQKWTALPPARLPAIAPGARVTLQTPWASSGLARGNWPVKCEIVSSGDGSSANNVAEHVFKKVL